MMGWASFYIADLKRGLTVTFRPKGNSMAGRVENGALCTVDPIMPEHMLAVGDVVLCTVGGRQYLHLITAMHGTARYQISNNKGHVNGWISLSNIHGKLRE